MFQLNDQQMRKIYTRYMVDDFPEDELKPLSMILTMMDNGQAEAYGWQNNQGDLSAYAVLVRFENFYVLDYLAVVSGQRGQGIGSHVLKDLQHIHPQMECIFLEVENPDYAQGEEKALRKRRYQFYIRNGVHDTLASGKVYGVEYKFLEIPGLHTHTALQANQWMSRYYHQYWFDEASYHRYIKMHPTTQS